MTIGLPLTRLVSDNPLHLQEVPRLLFIAGVFQIPFAITMVLRQALRGVGDTRWCLFITTEAAIWSDCRWLGSSESNWNWVLLAYGGP